MGVFPAKVCPSEEAVLTEEDDKNVVTRVERESEASEVYQGFRKGHPD